MAGGVVSFSPSCWISATNRAYSMRSCPRATGATSKAPKTAVTNATANARRFLLPITLATVQLLQREWKKTSERSSYGLPLEPTEPSELAALGSSPSAVDLVPKAPSAPASANTSAARPGSWSTSSTEARSWSRYQPTWEGLVSVVSTPTTVPLLLLRPVMSPSSKSLRTLCSGFWNVRGSRITTTESTPPSAPLDEASSSRCTLSSSRPPPDT